LSARYLTIFALLGNVKRTNAQFTGSDIGDIEGFVIDVYDWDALGRDDFLGEG
jgi:hypothetical protein